MNQPSARPVTHVPPAVLQLDPTTGAMSGATRRYQKRLNELDGLFHDSRAFAAAVDTAADRLVYEVYEHRVDERPGDLIFGTSILYPGKIGREYAMTRGHLHRVADRTEIYHCLRGHGVLLMESLGGEIRAAELTPGTVAYVGPYWIHRSVNVGEEQLVTVFCYPADSGQDYEIIAESHGMSQLVVDDGAGGWTTVDNPGYRSRER